MIFPVKEGETFFYFPGPRAAFLLLILCVLFLYGVPPACAEGEDGDGETLFLSVYFNKKKIADIIEADERGGQVFVDPREIAILLESAVPEGAPKRAALADLEILFPAEFTFSDKLQVLIITGHGELPLEKRLERERLHKILAQRSKPETEYREIPLDFKFFSPPILDVSTSYEFNGKGRAVYSASGLSEALYGTLRVQAQGDDHELNDLLLSWEHIEHNGSFKGGDIFSNSIDLVARGEAGKGFVYSTLPVEHTTRFDSETIEGLLQTGWEVELYRNQVLLDFQADQGTGRFVFEDVPLLFGENEILLRFHGPQGQVREEIRQAYIGGAMVPSGETWARVTVLEQGENLFLGRDPSTRQNISGMRATGEVFHGLTQNLTLTSTLTTLNDQTQERRIYGMVGLRGAYLGASESLSFLTDDQGGRAFEAAVQRNIFDAAVRYSHVEFFDLVTELERDLLRRDTLKVDGYFETLSLGAEVERETTRRGTTLYDLVGRVSGRLAGLWLTNRVKATVLTEHSVTGDFLVSGHPMDNMNLRGTLDYALSPIAELQSASATADYKVGRDLRLQLGMSKSFLGDKDYSVHPGFSWAAPMALLGLTGSYSTGGEYRVIASMSFSLGPDPKGDYGVHGEPGTTTSRVNVRVFQDNDNNGVYNEDDEVLEGVRLIGKQGTSDENGLVSFRSPSYHQAQIGVNEKTLEDPYSIPSPPLSVRPRPGRQITIDFPIWETGEIEGLATPGATIELLKEGEVIRQVRAEFDGFVLFEKVRFGTYTVRTEGAESSVSIDQKHPIAVLAWEKQGGP